MRSRNVTPAKNHIVRPLEEWTKTSLIVESSKINSYDDTLDIPVIIIIQGIYVIYKFQKMASPQKYFSFNFRFSLFFPKEFPRAFTIGESDH